MIYYLSHLTSVHINKSAVDFKNSSEALFLHAMLDDDDDLSEGDSDKVEGQEEEQWEEEEKEEFESNDSDEDDNELLVRSIHFPREYATKLSCSAQLCGSIIAVRWCAGSFYILRQSHCGVFGTDIQKQLKLPTA